MLNFLATPEFAMVATFTVILVGVGLYCWDKFAIELVSGGIIAAFLLLFTFVRVEGVTPSNAELLSGFANPALITILALLIIGQGLFQTGAMEAPSRFITRIYDARPSLALLMVFSFVFVVSAFINNTPIVVMFVPVLAAMAMNAGRSPSKVMMPLSFVSILGGMLTLIGSSTNLLVADSLFNLTGERLEFFTPTVPGLALAGVGIVYMLTIGRWLMPHRAPLTDDVSGLGDGKQFIAQIEITNGHPLEGAKPTMGQFQDLENITVRMVQRGEHAYLPPFDDIALHPGDLVVIAATRKRITDLLSSRPQFVQGMLSSVSLDEEGEAVADGLSVTEAVVAPGSRLIGRTIEQAGFRYQTGCMVLGIQRRSRMIRSRMGEIRLEAGDTLLIFGPRRAVRSLRTNRDVLLLEWSRFELPDLAKANYARFVFLGTVAAAAIGILPIVVSAVIGAMVMIATGCLNIRQASRAVDSRIFLLIGAAFAMGVSLEKTGGASLIATTVVNTFDNWGPAVLLSALFLLIAVLTNILSNSATAILFSPIAVNAAQQMNVDPIVFVLTVIFAANCSFATPIAYQTNLLVMGPGHYRFADFLRVGAPLVFLLWVTYSVFAPWYFQL